MGASLADIVVRLNREFVVLIGVALVVAPPVAYGAVQQWLFAFTYRIDIDPLVFRGAGAGGLAIPLAAASYQTWTAARVHPAEALRQE